MTLLIRPRRGPVTDRAPTRDRAPDTDHTGGAASSGPFDVRAIRGHFVFPEHGRIVTNNAASTQPPRELLALYQALAPGYENVHRGQSSASRQLTAQFEASYDTIAEFIGAPGRSSVALYKNTTEAINAVMYSLLTEFRDGDNAVTTTMEHNSNYVPWYAMCRETPARRGPAHVARRVQPRRPRPSSRGRGPERGRGGVTGGPATRHAPVSWPKITSAKLRSSSR
jgi:aminotransferase class V